MVMKIELIRPEPLEIFSFQSTNETGKVTNIDATVEPTDPTPTAQSPMELVLSGVAGCSSVDVLHILRKQRLEPTFYKVLAEAKRRESPLPKVFTHIHLTFIFSNDIPEAKAKNAIELSLNKYCSVSLMLKATVDIDYSIAYQEENEQ